MTIASSPLLLTIEAIEPKPGFGLEIAWAGGAKSMVDLSSSIATGGVFAPLADPALFRKVRVGQRRRTVEWPEPVGDDGAPSIDIDADALSAMGGSSDKTVGAAGKAQRRVRAPNTPDRRRTG